MTICFLFYQNETYFFLVYIAIGRCLFVHYLFIYLFISFLVPKLFLSFVTIDYKKRMVRCEMGKMMERGREGGKESREALLR